MSEDEKKAKELTKRLEKEKSFLSLKAKDFMAKEVISISPDATIRETLLLMQKNNLTGLPVIEKGGKVVGIISDYDILLQVAQKSLDERIFFKRDLISVTMDTPIKEILVTFVRFKLRRIPVVDAFQKLVGMIYREEFIFKIMETKLSVEKKSEAA
jgi:IMP dehydrogenase